MLHKEPAVCALALRGVCMTTALQSSAVRAQLQGLAHDPANVCRKVIAQNGKFYGRFPGDAEQVRRIVRFLIAQPDGGVRTPSGNFLSPQGLQSLGCPGLCAYTPTWTTQHGPTTYRTDGGGNPANQHSRLAIWNRRSRLWPAGLKWCSPKPDLRTGGIFKSSCTVLMGIVAACVGLGSYGGMERLHYLLERVWERPDEELSIHFLKVRQTLRRPQSPAFPAMCSHQE